MFEPRNNVQGEKKKKKKTQVLSLLEGTKNFIPSTIEFFSTWKYKPILQEHIAESKNSTYYNLNSILSVCKGSWIYGLIIMVQELLLPTSGFSLHAHTAYNNSSHKNHLKSPYATKEKYLPHAPQLKMVQFYFIHTALQQAIHQVPTHQFFTSSP